jgi:hypothetical protein
MGNPKFYQSIWQKKMSKRNYVSEILQKKQRTASTTRRWNLVSERLSHIRSIIDVALVISNFHQLEKTEELKGKGFDFLLDQIKKEYPVSTLNYSHSHGLSLELMRYIPIALVACIEGYFRKLYADLIDYGSPYKENASKIPVPDTKFSIETIISLEVNPISIGDFVAHLLKANNLEDINKNISILIGDDFLGRLKAMRNRAINQQQSLFPINEEEQMGYMIQRIEHMFKLRNMFCHEIDPLLPEEDIQRILSYPETIIDFLWISEFLINDLLSR